MCVASHHFHQSSIDAYNKSDCHHFLDFLSSKDQAPKLPGGLNVDDKFNCLGTKFEDVICNTKNACGCERYFTVPSRDVTFTLSSTKSSNSLSSKEDEDEEEESDDDEIAEIPLTDKITNLMTGLDLST